jgi:LCP family protein required for cell wall assembly
MIEQLRDTFGRHEHLVPDAGALKPVIDRRVRIVRARRRKAWSVAGAFALVLSIVAPAAALRRLPGESILPLTTPPSLAPAPAGPVNLLLLGVDARPGGDPAQARSDAILIVHVDAAHKRAWTVSIPRDLAVEVPGHGLTRANVAYLAGGYPLAEQTIAKLTGVAFDAGVVIDFNGMQKVTEAVGGVTMCVDQPVTSVHIGHDAKGRVKPPFRDGKPVLGVKPVVYEPGCRHFEAWQALDYVRQRSTLAGGEQDRDRHLRQFLGALVKELTNPVKLTKALPVASAALDLHLGGTPLIDLATGLRDVDPDRIDGVRMPVWPTKDSSGTVQQPDSAGLFEALRDDTLSAWVAAHPEYT